jgi:hypothetical protein
MVPRTHPSPSPHVLRRRHMRFNPVDMCLTWHAGDAAGGKPLGEFKMDPCVMLAAPTIEHSKPHEIKVTGRGRAGLGGWKADRTMC